MEAVTVSTKYQVVIPQKVRELLRVKPGQKMRVICYDNQVIFVPIRSIKNARGFLKGINTNIIRDEKDRV